MAIPDLIEIIPFEKPVRAEITVPGSKSITNRALILAALADGETTLQGALWSEDTQVMVEALRHLGFEIKLARDPNEFCNRTITVKGLGGKLPDSGTTEAPFEIFVRNAGTVARFLAPMVCLGGGVYRLDGTPRMRERPQAALFQALRELGYRIDSPNDKLPAVIHGSGSRVGHCHVSIEESSQFASGLILSSIRGGWRIEVTGENLEESPYVAMTDKLLATFPHHGGSLQIEPDTSSGSYFLAAGLFVPRPERLHSGRLDLAESILAASHISVVGWPVSDWQVDRRFLTVLPTQVSSDFRLMFANPKLSRRRDLGDSIMTAIVLAPFSIKPVWFTDLGRLRVQECERVIALRTELVKCGANILEEGDSLQVLPSDVHGAEIETYNDHRMAMCFAILGLKVPGIKLKNPSCVKKTFPNFFQKLAGPPPHGLGATILDASNGRPLGLEELFAD